MFRLTSGGRVWQAKFLGEGASDAGGTQLFRWRCFRRSLSFFFRCVVRALSRVDRSDLRRTAVAGARSLHPDAQHHTLGGPPRVRSPFASLSQSLHRLLQVGGFQGCYIPNPSATSETQLSKLEFVGQLIGRDTISCVRNV
jgi:hypothetical protein